MAELARAHAKELPSEVVDAMRRATSLTTTLVEGPIRFIVVQVRSDDLMDAPALLSEVFKIAARHDVFVESVMVSMVLLTFGFPDNDTRSNEGFQNVLTELRQHLGQRARAVYGKRTCLRGTIAHDTTAFFGSFFSGFDLCLATLAQTSFGESSKLSN